MRWLKLATNFFRFATKISPSGAEVRPPSFVNIESCEFSLSFSSGIPTQLTLRRPRSLLALRCTERKSVVLASNPVR